MQKVHSPATSRRSWLPCGCLLVMFLVCVFLPVAAFLAWTFRASGQVEAQLARIRQAGLPAASSELDTYYQLAPGAKDATDLYLVAQREFSGSKFEADCTNLPIVGNSDLEIPPPGQPWADQPAVEAMLAEYANGLRALHKAADMGGAARFPLEFEDGYAMLLPHAQEMRTCARMLALEAHVKAHQGDAAGAAESIRDIVTISRSLENQPILVSQLVRVAIHGMAANLTEELLSHVEFSDDDLEQLQQAFRRDDFKAGLSQALVGERVMGAAVFKNPAQAMGHDEASPASRLVRGSNEDLALFLKIQNDLHAAVQPDYPQTFDEVNAAVDQMHRKISTPMGRLRYVITALTLPAVESCVTAAARADGTNRALDATIAVERYRRRHGKLPASLDELVPDFLDAVPTDPSDGQPIRYAIKPDGYLLYICGRDRVDDGGIEDESFTDEVFRVFFKSDDARPATTGSDAISPAATPSDAAPNNATPAATPALPAASQ